MNYPHTIDIQSGMERGVALDMLLDPSTTRIGYPTSAYTCKFIGGPFVVGTGVETLSYASNLAFRIS